MNDKYSFAKCEQYGRRLAARLCDQHFGSQPDATLDGPAILKFTSVRQVNLLVVRQLMGQWQGEMARLRSPYFDFEAEPVQTALTQFMNVLSRHIRVGRAAFEPLLARAAADTLLIVADPTGTFERLFLGNEPEPKVARLRENLRYIDFDKDFFQGFIDSLTSTAEPTREFLLQRFGLYHAANYKAHQPMQRLVTALSSLLPLTEADLREDGPVSAISAAPAAPAEPSAKPLAKAEPVPTPALPPTPPPAAAPAPAAAPQPAPVEVVPEPPKPTPVAPIAVPSFVAAAPPEPLAAPVPPAPAPASSEGPLIPLHEKLKAHRPANAPLAETLRASAGTAPMSERSAPKVETLREAISINQRFSFINELFNGENMEYHSAIQQLDSYPNAELARSFVNNDLSQRYDWSRKEEHVNKLLKLIERKFA
ncbi:hypothetical protein GCM10023185_27140 [Hymenobacter saemangeumensis]|uniref:DUF4476 domain-containing protein n=1 Tax=Hymenobacter saemangeumensis TaxID=1084522 RepID=A0ABP8IJ78_9BACT